MRTSAAMTNLPTNKLPTPVAGKLCAMAPPRGKRLVFALIQLLMQLQAPAGCCFASSFSRAASSWPIQVANEVNGQETISGPYKVASVPSLDMALKVDSNEQEKTHNEPSRRIGRVPWTRTGCSVSRLPSPRLCLIVSHRSSKGYRNQPADTDYDRFV